MPETDESTGPTAFLASFPPEPRFAATAGEIACRLAAACGCPSADAEEVRNAVSAAFGEAVPLAAAGESDIDLALRTADDAFEAEVACGGRALLRCSKARSS
jgi:hypothetical protein